MSAVEVSNSTQPSNEADKEEQKHGWCSWDAIFSRIFTHYEKEICKSDLKHMKESNEEIMWHLVFLDLIFVGVVYNVEYIISHCGIRVNTYIVAISYFAIMFNTRHQIDFYACCYVVREYLLRCKDKKKPKKIISETESKLHTDSNHENSGKGHAIPIQRPHHFAPTPILQNDFFNRVVLIIYGLGAFLMTVNIDEDIKDTTGTFGYCNFNRTYSGGFVVGFIVSRCLIMFWNAVIVLSGIEAARKEFCHNFIFRSIHSLVTIFIMVVFPFIDEKNMLYCLPVVAALDLLADVIRLGIVKLIKYLRNRKGFQILFFYSEMHEIQIVEKAFVRQRIEQKTKSLKALPQKISLIFCNFDKFLEQMGLIFMLVCGEAIVGLTFGSYYYGGPGMWIAQIFTYLLIASTAMQFFETVEKTEDGKYKQHALLNGSILSTMFYGLHIAASFSLLVGIVGIMELYHYAAETALLEASSHEISHSMISWMTAVGLLLTEMCLVLLRLLHIFYYDKNKKDLNDSKVSFVKQVIDNFKTHFENKTTLAFAVVYLTGGFSHLIIYFICNSSHAAAYTNILLHALVSVVINGAYIVRQTFYRKHEPASADVNPDENHLSELERSSSEKTIKFFRQSQEKMPRSYCRIDRLFLKCFSNYELDKIVAPTGNVSSRHSEDESTTVVESQV